VDDIQPDSNRHGETHNSETAQGCKQRLMDTRTSRHRPTHTDPQIHIHTQTDRQTYTQTDRQRNRQTDRQTHRQTQRHTQTDPETQTDRRLLNLVRVRNTVKVTNPKRCNPSCKAHSRWSTSAPSQRPAIWFHSQASSQALARDLANDNHSTIQ